MKKLTTTEHRELEQCEEVITHGLETFVEVGRALLAIRDRRLYRQEHSTFEEYCQGRWEMVARHANRLIQAAEVVGNLGPIGPKPETESQTRPLAGLSPEQQVEAWTQAVETAKSNGNGKVTAALVEEAVEVVTGRQKPKTNRAGDIYEPQGFDACQTPAYAIDPLLAYLPNDWTIWEPACGERILVEAFYDAGREVVGSDILEGPEYNFFTYGGDDPFSLLEKSLSGANSASYAGANDKASTGLEDFPCGCRSDCRLYGGSIADPKNHTGRISPWKASFDKYALGRKPRGDSSDDSLLAIPDCASRGSCFAELEIVKKSARVSHKAEGTAKRLPGSRRAYRQFPAGNGPVRHTSGEAASRQLPCVSCPLRSSLHCMMTTPVSQQSIKRDWAIVTNPPFSIKYKWLERCYQFGKPFALLLPVETLGAKSAQVLFVEHGIEVILLNRRLNFKMPNIGWDGSSAQFPVAWFTWQLHLPTQIVFGRVPDGN